MDGDVNRAWDEDKYAALQIKFRTHNVFYTDSVGRHRGREPDNGSSKVSGGGFSVKTGVGESGRKRSKVCAWSQKIGEGHA